MFNVNYLQTYLAIAVTIVIPFSPLATTNSVAATNLWGLGETESVDNLVVSQDSDAGHWWDIFRRNRGEASRGPDDLCVISPYGEIRYSWSRSPLFVWFDPQHSIKRVQLRTRDSLEPIWTFNPPASQDAMGLYQVTYDGPRLMEGKTYYFEMYQMVEVEERDSFLHGISLEVLPEDAYATIQDELDDLQQNSLGMSRDALIEERIKFFADRGFSEDGGLIDLTELSEDSEQKGLFLDVVRELFNLEDAAEKDRYINAMYTEYCVTEEEDL